jgi:iron complex outermembrane receptor protein
MGTPDNRVNLGLTWELNKLRVSAAANYRGALKNTNFKNDPDGCAFHYANGDDAPAGCELASFTSIDLNARYKINEKMELFGTVQNLFDKRAPLDPLTYGAVSYNPLDFAGAVGRYFSGGLKYTF